MILIIDIGNTSVKAAMAVDGKFRNQVRLKSASPVIIGNYIGRSEIDAAIVSSVGTDPEPLLSWLGSRCERVHLLTPGSRFPFSIEYSTPETLGTDRLAAAAGACYSYPGANLLVIDAGSAMTLDQVTGGFYRGGSISPGLSMRFRALNEFTGRLPLVQQRKQFTFPGQSTADAIAGGVLMGMVYEINEYIRTFGEKHRNPVTVITGGDGEILSGLTTGKVWYHADLVTSGLYYLLEENA